MSLRRKVPILTGLPVRAPQTTATPSDLPSRLARDRPG
jgi:hypothetical protein